MFQKLVSHNADLRHLVAKGFAVAFDSNCLVVRDIPYLDGEAKLQWGAIVSKMLFPVDNDHATQEDHQVFFAGGVPHGLDRRPVQNLGGGPTTLALSVACADVIVQ